LGQCKKSSQFFYCADVVQHDWLGGMNEGR
jgi:hypothetical protein